MSLAIAEMEHLLGEARRMAEEPGHGVAHAIHVFAALAMNFARRREPREPITKAMRRCEPACMQLRVSAGEPADVAVLWRRFVGKRREGNDLGPCAPPP